MKKEQAERRLTPMNNTIEVLESIGKKYLIGAEGSKAINKAIATLKVLESAEETKEKEVLS